jgi:hypothetical protein
LHITVNFNNNNFILLYDFRVYNSVTPRPPPYQGSEVIAPVKYTTVAPKPPPYSEVGTQAKYATATSTAPPPAYYPTSTSNTQT